MWWKVCVAEVYWLAGSLEGGFLTNTLLMLNLSEGKQKWKKSVFCD